MLLAHLELNESKLSYSHLRQFTSVYQLGRTAGWIQWCIANSSWTNLVTQDRGDSCSKILGLPWPSWKWLAGISKGIQRNSKDNLIPEFHLEFSLCCKLLPAVTPCLWLSSLVGVPTLRTLAPRPCSRAKPNHRLSSHHLLYLICDQLPPITKQPLRHLPSITCQDFSGIFDFPVISEIFDFPFFLSSILHRSYHQLAVERVMQQNLFLK